MAEKRGEKLSHVKADALVQQLADTLAQEKAATFGVTPGVAKTELLVHRLAYTFAEEEADKIGNTLGDVGASTGYLGRGYLIS